MKYTDKDLYAAMAYCELCDQAEREPDNYEALAQLIADVRQEERRALAERLSALVAYDIVGQTLMSEDEIASVFGKFVAASNVAKLLKELESGE